ncbi:MFS transporter [Streptomyces sp. 1114.5]|uniref:MFS transporter n=1 Tax=Streptomyces sp. 1114.5 TaxID=1938830 RepID=UPI000EAC6FA6|nr:MFS transporter [Streptomyces sp. 1114.5]RKT11913.1 MFS transporter [Streptomyces sp. 1114.5]
MTTSTAESSAPSPAIPESPGDTEVLGAVRRRLHPDPTVRRLAGITLVNTVGNGLSLSVAVLFFTRVLGLSAAQLGLGMTAAGLCGVVASVPAGRAADRWGARRVLVTLVSVQAVGTAGYALVHSYPAFVALACLVSAVDRGSAAVRNALYAEVLPADRRVAGRAYLRVVTNVGICLGTALGAIALQVDTRPVYVAAILADAASFVVAALLFHRLSDLRRSSVVERSAGGGSAVDGSVADQASKTGVPKPSDPSGKGAKQGRRRNPALRDGPFLALTVLNAVLCLQFAVLEVGVPLWIVQQTDAPRITVAGTLVVNTLLVITLQMRATRGIDERTAAARACGRAGMVLAASCLVLSLAHGLPAVAAAVVVLGGVVLQSLGEVVGQAGGWALSYDLAGERDHGAYQGVFNAGTAAALMAGPALVSTLVIGYGTIGWVVLGAVLAAAGLAMRPVVRWAGRRDAGLAAV